MSIFIGVSSVAIAQSVSGDAGTAGKAAVSGNATKELPPVPPPIGDETQQITAERDQLWALAHQMEGENRLDDAAAKMRELVPLERRLVGDKHEELATAISYLSDLEFASGKLDAAKKDREEVLAIKVGLYGKESWQTKETRLTIGDCEAFSKLSEAQQQQWIAADQMVRQIVSFSQQGKASEALQTANQAVELYGKSAGPDHWRTANALNLQGQLLVAMGQDRKAIDSYKRAIEIDEKVFGAHPMTAAVLDRLGMLYLPKADPAAEAIFDRELKITQSVLGPEAPETQVAMNNLGVAYFNKQDYKTAIDIHQRVLEMRRRLLGNEHPFTLLSLNALAQTNVRAKDYANALPLFLELHGLREKTLGGEHPQTVVALSCLARTNFELKKFDEALPLYEQLETLDARILGPADEKSVGDLILLVQLYEAKGNYARAREVGENLAISAAKAYGAESKSAAGCYATLATNAHRMGDYAAAVVNEKKAIAIYEKIAGPISFEMATELGNLGILYDDMDKPAEAL
ncbi:MAG TPA: tetratricopeptide repeat protein, partial [Pirellulales bacterium]